MFETGKREEYPRSCKDLWMLGGSLQTCGKLDLGFCRSRLKENNGLQSKVQGTRRRWEAVAKRVFHFEMKHNSSLCLCFEACILNVSCFYCRFCQEAESWPWLALRSATQENTLVLLWMLQARAKEISISEFMVRFYDNSLFCLVMRTVPGALIKHTVAQTFSNIGYKWFQPLMEGKVMRRGVCVCK